MNKVFLIGNLTKDPDLATTNSGLSVCRFTIAITRRFQNAEGERDADFINITTWKNQADICHKYLRKGSKVGVVGRIQTGSYTAQDGTKRYTTDVVADEVEFLNTKASGEGSSQTKKFDEESQPKKSDEEVAQLQPIDDDNLPF